MIILLNIDHLQFSMAGEVDSGDTTCSIQWRDLKVRTKAGRRLLHSISGVALPGEVVALMGASGAGKTTLLNSLLQRNMKGLVVEGEILVNGQKIGKNVSSVSAYVQQEDLFVGTLTVREHLLIQARLRLGNDSRELEDRVTQVMQEMLLEESQSSRIGVPGIVKGISGGEMKRLAFATEMLNNPPILFCDEPTTGLDSHMAMTVVQRLEAMAADCGKTIICTIHQPSSEVFELFDKVVFLAQGRVAFHGIPHEAVLFFSTCGFLLPDHTNPADHYIDTLAICPDKVDECKERCKFIAEQFQTSELRIRLDKQMEEERLYKRLQAHKTNGVLQQISALFIRYFKANLRTPALLRAKIIQKIVMASFLVALYFRTERHQDGLISLTGALFYYISEITYATVFGVQTYMPLDFPLVVREYHDGIYPVYVYYFARILSYLPLFTFDGMLLIAISYFGIGFTAKVSAFVKALFNGMIIEWNVLALGVCVSAISPSYAFAVSITGPLLTALSVTGGLMVNVDVLPAWISWIQYLSWFRFGYENFIINEFGESDIYDCVDRFNIVTPFCIKSNEDVMDKLSFHPGNFYANWLVMFLYTIGIYVLGYVGLVYRVLRAR